MLLVRCLAELACMGACMGPMLGNGAANGWLFCRSLYPGAGLCLLLAFHGNMQRFRAISGGVLHFGEQTG